MAKPVIVVPTLSLRTAKPTEREAISMVARDLRKTNPNLSQEAAEKRVRAAVVRGEKQTEKG